MSDEVCQDRMREDWNQRAREDANYFVAFGRRDQSEAEFFSTGADVVRSLEREMKRLAPAHREARRALEIGCGPGRLMRPMSRHFGEIHGVDVSDEMIRLAEMRLDGVANAHAHATSGSDLALFADETFDFVYSYAVFQHIPSREIVFQYLSEARRVLKTGGVLRCQINGLPASAKRYDTWCGVRIGAPEMKEFARDRDFQLLALENVQTQYMWTTMRKRPEGWHGRLENQIPQGQVRIRRITNPFNSEPVVPSGGRFACASLWVTGLPDDSDLNNLQITFDGANGEAAYLGPPEADGLQQLNVVLPSSTRTGLVPVQIFRSGQVVSAPASARVVPPGPAVPRVLSVTDGIDLLSGSRIVSGCVKVFLEEVPSAEGFHASFDGEPAEGLDSFCIDPLIPRFEVNFLVPATVSGGAHRLEMGYCGRQFAPIPIEVVRQP
jgi:SAM-dependent methyltransferase